MKTLPFVITVALHLVAIGGVASASDAATQTAAASVTPPQLLLPALPSQSSIEIAQDRNSAASAEVEALNAERAVIEAQLQLQQARGGGRGPMLVGIVGSAGSLVAEMAGPHGLRRFRIGDHVHGKWVVAAIEGNRLELRLTNTKRTQSVYLGQTVDAAGAK